MKDPTYKGEQSIPKKVATTSTVVAGPANLLGLLLTHDGTNDPTFTIYNAQAATGGKEIYSGTWTDSDRPIGWIGSRMRFDTGIHVVIANIGSGFLTFFYNEHFVLQRGV